MAVQPVAPVSKPQIVAASMAAKGWRRPSRRRGSGIAAKMASNSPSAGMVTDRSPEVQMHSVNATDSYLRIKLPKIKQ
ncbi:hypothetical protein CA13_32610 [Planctomycetes bacterium CA13]|uniref:Uncharacterized protein n=1 Tax=Novipirellula herctigrandis TaxID=2527986 RepID=A0A5C5Z3A0_9BACT|nr:hypothetical protein CA13_32610 [Planctomycetes bacterium CA13]